MKDASTISVILLAVVLTVLTAFWPHILSENEFLSEFVTHELLALLVIILTITFASVANIHLAISRIQTTITVTSTRDEIERQFARPLQAETRSSAWLLFWAFVICVVALLVKGEWPQNRYVISAAHGVGVLALYVNALVIYDIYATIFELVGVGRGDTHNTENSDFTNNDPPMS